MCMSKSQDDYSMTILSVEEDHRISRLGVLASRVRASVTTLQDGYKR